MLLLFKQAAIQNRFAPLSKNIHLLFCVFATILFLILYFRHKKIKDIFWMLACDMTAILQFYGDRLTAAVIGIFELVLLVLIFNEYRKEPKPDKKKKKKDGGDTSKDDRKDIEKAVKAERNRIPAEDGDIVSQAFDNEE